MDRLVFLLVAAAITTVSAGTVQVESRRDATLIQDSAGALANGAGPWLFAGHTDQEFDGLRRGLVQFDVAAALPPRAIVESVSLTLFNQISHDTVHEVRLHRVLGDWGEGPSYASGGGGALAESGDATWIHTFYDDEFWTREGGSFVARASAATEVGPTGFYTWSDTKHLLQDVRLWRAAPHLNHGWALVGNETENQTVKRFASHESVDPALRPVLQIEYRLPGKP